MKPGTRIAIALVGAALLLLVLWLLFGAQSSPPASAAVTAMPGSIEEDAAVRHPSEEADAEDPLESEEEAPPEAESERDQAAVAHEVEAPRTASDFGAFEYAIVVAVVDRLDRPLAGAMVNAGPRRHPLNFVSTTKLDGRVTVRWRAHVPLMDLVVAASGPRGTWTGLRAFPVSSGTEHTLRLVMPEEWFTTQSTKVVTDDTPEGRKAEALARRQRAESRVHRTPVSFFEAPPMDGGADGRWFRWPWEDAFGRIRSWNQEQFLRSLGYDDDSYERFVRRGDGEWIRIWLGPRDEPPEEEVPAARGRVLDAWLRPASGALVSAGIDEEAPLVGTYCDADGRFELPLKLPGDYRVWAGGGAFGQAVKGRRFTGSDTNWGELVLDRGRELAGELFYEDGTPLADWWLEVDALDGIEHLSDAAVCGTDGRFVFPNVRGSVSLLVGRPADAASLMPVLVEPVGSVESYERVVVERVARASLPVRVTEIGRADAGHVEVRVWQEASGRGELAGRAGNEGYHTGELPEGWYHFVAVSEYGGWSDEVRVRVGRGRASNVDLVLGGQGTVRFRGPRERRAAGGGTVWMRGREVDSRVASFDSQLPGRMDLPAGEYLLELGGELLPFAVLAGRGSDVRLPEVKEHSER